MRLFIGIPLADAAVAELAGACTGLRSDDDGLRWSAPDSWHITLQFLGNTTADQLHCLTLRLSELRAAPVPIQLGGLGLFDRAGVFYAGVELTPELIVLHEGVTAATAPCGFEPEARPYHPHVTLARAKGQSRGRQLRNLKTRIHTQPVFPRLAAEEFLLYESRPSPVGSQYEIRARFGLTRACY